MNAAGHRWRFYLSPAEAWEAMRGDCENAARVILLEQYIFLNDDIGKRFLELFARKAAEGVAVRALCDKLGSGVLADEPRVQTLRENGGTLRFYNAFSLLDLLRLRRIVPRTHVKMLVADDVAYIGGVCIADHMREWRDTQIRVTGPVAGVMREALERNLRTRRPFQVSRDPQDSGFAYIQSEPFHFRHAAYRAYVKAIEGARHTICISSAYFIPPRRLRGRIKRAARNGVEVLVLIPMRSDVPLADWVGLSFAPKLLRAGVRIFRYTRTMLHTKTMVVDDDWATIGSANMDVLSMFRNREANLIVTERAAVAEMKRQFFDDLRGAEEVTAENLRQMPLWQKLAAQACRPLRAFF